MSLLLGILVVCVPSAVRLFILNKFHLLEKYLFIIKLPIYSNPSSDNDKKNVNLINTNEFVLHLTNTINSYFGPYVQNY